MSCEMSKLDATKYLRTRKASTIIDTKFTNVTLIKLISGQVNMQCVWKSLQKQDNIEETSADAQQKMEMSHLLQIICVQVCSYRSHGNSSHGYDSTFRCPICSKTLKSRLKLKQHNRKFHDANKFKCKKCSSSFSFKSLLAEHVKVKHEGKRYHCSYSRCPKKFSFRRSATKHLQEIHKLKGNKYKKYQKFVTLL